MRLQWAMMTGLLLALIGWPGVGVAREGVVPAEIAHKAQADGVVRVIVQLDVPTQPEGALSSAQAVLTQRQAIAVAQTELLADLAGTNHRVTRQFATIPFLALEAPPDALAALERSARAVGVTEDRLAVPFLAESVPLVEADQAWDAGFDGSGWAVAVLDTGVDKDHPFLTGKVVAEACFSGNGNCPNGGTTQIGLGAGVPCTYAVSGCTHGTHVAGIAAGRGDSFSGVARGASLIAIQVFSRFTGAVCGGGEDPCALSFTSDQIAGLEHVLALRTDHQIPSANMSLGGGRFTDQASCDAARPGLKAVIDNLRSERIATVIASGNNGFVDAISAPGCISTAVSVGSTTKTDLISLFSNSAPFLSLLAPGSSINSSIPGGGFGIKSGTSMATPHLAGAWAILKQKSASAPVIIVLGALQTKGLLITDPRNEETTPRIQIFQALNTHLAVSPVLVHYLVRVGESQTKEITIGNFGDTDLVITDIRKDESFPEHCDVFTISHSGPSVPFTIHPGERESVEVVFAPPSPDMFDCPLAIASDDPETPVVEVMLWGTGTEEGMATGRLGPQRRRSR